MTDDEDKSFRERVEEIRERREAQNQQQQQNISINGMNTNGGQSSSAGGGFSHENLAASRVTIELTDETLEFENVMVQKTRLGGQLMYGISGHPEGMSNGMFASQSFEYSPLQADHVAIEFGDEILEFENITLQKSVMNGQHLYGVPGEPDRRRSTDRANQTDDGETADSKIERSKTRRANAEEDGSEDRNPTAVYTPDENTGGSSPPSGASSNAINFCPGCSADLSGVASPSFCPDCGRDLSDLG